MHSVAVGGVAVGVGVGVDVGVGVGVVVGVPVGVGLAVGVALAVVDLSVPPGCTGAVELLLAGAGSGSVLGAGEADTPGLGLGSCGALALALGLGWLLGSAGADELAVSGWLAAAVSGWLAAAVSGWLAAAVSCPAGRLAPALKAAWSTWTTWARSTGMPAGCCALGRTRALVVAVAAALVADDEHLFVLACRVWCTPVSSMLTAL
jgi:hypothetical protein